MTLFDIKYDDFKREDTTNTIVITLYTDDRQPITPDASHTWKAKVSKEDKYVGEYPVTISGNTIKLSSSNLTRLPNGDYGLELWETYSGSTTIYPSAGVMEFRVHRNANDTLGTIDPTTDINAIIDDLHKAGQNVKVVATNTLPAGSKASVTQSITNGENQLTFNIPQGIQGEQGNVGPAPTLKIGAVTKLNPDQAPTANVSGDNGVYTLDLGIPQGSKGDTGTVNNTGLISAPAFQSLQTQVNNSAVGTNLLTGTGYHTVKGTNASNYLSDETTDDLLTLFRGLEGQTVTVSVDYEYSGFIAGKGWNRLGWQTQITADTTQYLGAWYYPNNDSGSGRISSTFVIPKNITSVGGSRGYIMFPGSGTGTLSNLKLEKGSVATPWCPNPSEILTQSDYAKIKAAIVALGGLCHEF